MTQFPHFLPDQASIQTHGDFFAELLAVADSLGVNHPWRATLCAVNDSNASGHNPVPSGGAYSISGTQSGGREVMHLQTAASAGAGCSEVFSSSAVSGDTRAHAYGALGLRWTTDVRFFFGVAMGDMNMDEPYSSAYAAGSYAGVQFSTPRGDSNFQFVAGDGGAGSQVKVDSGIAADVNMHNMAVVLDGDNAKIMLDGASAVLPYSSGRFLSFGVWAYAQADAEAGFSRRILRCTYDLGVRP